MYDLNAVRRRIGKEGVGPVIEHLSSEDFPEDLKEKLTKVGVFVNGHLNHALLQSLS